VPAGGSPPEAGGEVVEEDEDEVDVDLQIALRLSLELEHMKRLGAQVELQVAQLCSLPLFLLIFHQATLFATSVTKVAPILEIQRGRMLEKY